MPELDFALLAEHVQLEPPGLAHVISGGMDVIKTPELPNAINIGLLLRVSFGRAECDRPHRVEVIIQDEDGHRLAQLATTGKPDWPEGLPVNWKSNQPFAFNFSVAPQDYGEYEFVILVNDSQVKALPFRVVRSHASASSDGAPELE